MPSVDISRSPCVDCLLFITCKRYQARHSYSISILCDDRRKFFKKICDRINNKRVRRGKWALDDTLINNTLVRKENKYMELKYGSR